MMQTAVEERKYVYYYCQYCMVDLDIMFYTDEKMQISMLLIRTPFSMIYFLIIEVI